MSYIFIINLFAGLLKEIFYCLYNDDVISQEGFDAWLKDNDKAEEQGKGVAIKSTTHFFTWMREPDQDDGDKEDEWIFSTSKRRADSNL